MCLWFAPLLGSHIIHGGKRNGKRGNETGSLGCYDTSGGPKVMICLICATTSAGYSCGIASLSLYQRCISDLLDATVSVSADYIPMSV